MDEFAQTRDGDDLFDEDFTPIAESHVRSFDPPTPVSQNQERKGERRDGYAPRGRANRASDSSSRQKTAQPTPTASEAQRSFISDVPNEQDHKPSVETGLNTIPHQEHSTPQLKQSTAVRGDRTATGGTPKPKLTDEELTARLAAVKVNNAKRAEAHRLAEADEANFQQREENASQKRKEEGQVKRIMNMEREKNRLRKLGSQAGREWDEGKEEVDKREERGSQYRKGAHGGVAYARQGGGGSSRGVGNDYQDGDSNKEVQERRGGYRGRGRGERGDRGRGRGRGAPNLSNNSPQEPPDPVADFPALPTTSKSIQRSRGRVSDTPLSPAAEGSSWADEMEAAKVPDSGW